MNIIKHILIPLKPFLISLAKNCIYSSNFGDVSFKLKGGLGFSCAQRRKKYLNQEEKFFGEYGYSFYYVDEEGHIFCKVKL